ncbi:hypothetical protein [Streptomyces sp. C36]|uniref:hypothetical protein n=1 Tax=Streptomyces sp. C36 TaxID=3237122 RepID=UPI0034C6B006
MASTDNDSFRWWLLSESLTALSAESSRQRAWVEEHGVAADELALDFDHALRTAAPFG